MLTKYISLFKIIGSYLFNTLREDVVKVFSISLLRLINPISVVNAIEIFPKNRF